MNMKYSPNVEFLAYLKSVEKQVESLGCFWVRANPDPEKYIAICHGGLLNDCEASMKQDRHRMNNGCGCRQRASETVRNYQR